MFYSQTRSLVRSNVLRKRLCSTVRNEAVPESPALLPGRGYFVFVTGALAGGIGSLVGMGGAFVALPFLTGAFRLAPHLAHGTSMAAVLATSAGGCLAYMQRDHEFLEKLKSIDLNNMPAQIGNVNLLIGAAVAASSSVTVLLGTRIAHALSSIGLRKAMGVFMMLIAPTVPLREYLKNIKPSEGNDELESTTSVNLRDIPGTFEKVIKPLCVGACSGVLAGVFGVGGGAITVPALSIFTNLDYQVALGTSLFAMMPTAIAGSLSNISRGTMVGPIAVPLAAGCFVGSYVTGTYGRNFDDTKLKYGYAGIMTILGGRTLWALRKLK